MTAPSETTFGESRSTGRTGRIVRAVGLGYLSQFLTVLVGLWLTPFLLRRLGQQDYGLWQLALQMTGYLALLDLGVVALLPRETAYAIGRAGGNRNAQELSLLIGRTIRVVLCQLPIAALVAGVVLLVLPADWLPLRGPLYLIVGAFLLMFPLRVMQAILYGLQEMPYLGTVSLGTWALGTVTTVSGVLAGMGLYALALGWAVSQLCSALLWWLRIRGRYAAVLPRTLPPMSRELLAAWLRSGLWISVGQVAYVMLAGTDLLIIARFLGPAAIVPYAITGKLIAVLANQPQMVMQPAQVALSEIRATESERHRLSRMTTALSQMMLMLSGAVFVVVLVVNQGFVNWWIEPRLYGGFGLTFGLLACMMLRHWNTTLSSALFAFGNEKRIAITTLLDGVITVIAATSLVRLMGPVGAVIGSIVGVCVVSLPTNVRALVADTRSSVRAVFMPLAGWFGRFIVFALGALAVARTWVPHSLITLLGAAALVASLYALLMLPVTLRPPLGEYLRPRISAFSNRFLRVRRHGAPI